MTRPSSPRRSPRRKPLTRARIAGIVYASIPITMSAVVFLGSFI